MGLLVDPLPGGEESMANRSQGGTRELSLLSELVAWKTPLQEGEGQCPDLSLQKALP